MSKSRTIFEIILRIGILIGLTEFCIKKEYVPLNNYYSFIFMIYLSFFITILSFKYLILRNELEHKKRIIFMLVTILVYALLMKIGIELLYHNFETYNLGYKYIFHSKKTVYSFLVLSKYAKDVHFRELMIVDTIVSLLIVALEFFRRKNEEKKWGYFFERTEKTIFRFFWIILFFLECLTFSSKIQYIRNIKAVGKYLSIFFIGIGVIRYLVIYQISKRIKKKENLIVILTPNNFDFSVCEHYISPLRNFRKYDKSSFMKSLIVEGNNYVFVTYEAIRYHFISLEDYKNVVYVINTSGNRAMLAGTETSFAKKALEIIHNENYIIYCKSFSEFEKQLKRSYNYRCISKMDPKKILDVIHSDKNMDKVKNKAFKALEYISLCENRNYHELNKTLDKVNFVGSVIEKEDPFYSKLFVDTGAENKNDYLKYGLKVIINSFNYVEIFYTLLKMSEYQIHYMGLKSIILKDDIEEREKNEIKKGFLSTWRKFIPIERIYRIENVEEDNYHNTNVLLKKIEEYQNLVTEKDLVNSINSIYHLDSSQKIKDKKEYSFDEVCKVIADIRNGYVAHGAISYEFAQKICLYLFDVYFTILREFEDLKIKITEDEKIKQVLERDLSAIYQEKDGLFLYSNTRTEEKKDVYSEALNYESGHGKIIDKKVIFHIDNRYKNEEIEAGLKRKVIKKNEI